MFLRRIARNCSLASYRKYGSASENAFPVLEASIQTSDQTAIKRSRKAESEFLKSVFTCQSGGGEKGIHKHTVVNRKVFVRDRIRHILDDDSEFFEICTTAGLGLDYGDVPGAATVTGIGTVRGSKVMVIASDGSLKGGTSYPITVTKSLRAQEIAMENRLACLYLVDSGGAFLPLQSDIFPDVKHGGRTFRNQAVMSGLGIPQVAVVAGPCTAGGAYTPTMSDEAVMVNGIGHVFLGGPPLVKAATGEVVSHEDLGGAKLHTSISGVADYFAANETESFQQVRDIISGLNLDPLNKTIDPANDAPVFEASDLDYLSGLNCLGKDEVRAVIARIVDHSRFSEFKAPFGKNLTVGFAKLCNQVVAICANSGHLTPQDGQKGSHFLQLCQSRNIPVIFLQNNNGQDDTIDTTESIKEVAKFAHCSANMTVPKIALNIGGIGGFSDLIAMCGPSFGARFYLSWPRARYSKLDLKPTVDEASTDWDYPLESAQFAASRCTIDGIILPRETRLALARCLEIFLQPTPYSLGREAQQNSVLRI